MTGLEAIEIIRDRFVEYKNKADGGNIKCLISPQFAQVIMELEALEIIKEKQVDTEHIRICFSNEKGGFTEYNDWVELDTCRELTEEEYELLRKVLA